MARRNQQEIEQDYSRIREVAKTATCMKKLESMTGLSATKINYSLSKHPIVFNRIKEQLATNKANAEAVRKLEAEAAQMKAELEAKAKEDAKALAQRGKELEAESKALANASSKVEAVSATQEEQCIEFVIDASITGYEDLEDALAQIRATEAKFTLTSVTIRELDKLQKRNDIQAVDARHILALAAKEPENFKVVAIAESSEIADDNIIQYCVDNKERVTLLTSDKVMALKARMLGVHTQYLELPAHLPKIKGATTSDGSNSKPETSDVANKEAPSTGISKDFRVFPNYWRVGTLPCAQHLGKELVVSEFHSRNMSVRVFSGGREYNAGKVPLKVHDDVFTATKTADGVLFEFYHVLSLSPEDNCRLVYQKLIWKYTEVSRIKGDRYKKFIQDCLCRFDL